MDDLDPKSKLYVTLAALRQELQSGRYDTTSAAWIARLYLACYLALYGYSHFKEESLLADLSYFFQHIQKDLGVLLDPDALEMDCALEAPTHIAFGDHDCGCADDALVTLFIESMKSQFVNAMNINTMKAGMIDPMLFGDSQQDKQYVIGMSELTVHNMSHLFLLPIKAEATDVSEKMLFIRNATDFLTAFNESLELIATQV